MDIPQAAPLGFPHDHPDGLLVALIVPLHGLKYPDLSGNTLQLGSELPQPLGGNVSVFAAAVLPQSKAGDDIVGSGDLLLGILQRPAAILQIFLCFFPPGFAGGKVLFQLGETLPGALPVFFQCPHIRLTAGDLRLQIRLFGPQLQELFAQALGGSCHFGELPLGSGNRLPDIGQIPVDLGHPPLRLGDLTFQTSRTVLLALDFLLNAAQIGIVVFHIAPEHRHLPFQLLVGALEHGGLYPDRFQRSVLLPQSRAQLLRLTVKSVQIIVRLLQHKGCGLIVLLRLFRRSGELIQRIQPYGYLYAFQLLLHFQIFPGLFGLDLQRLQLQLQFRDLIANAKQIVFCTLQLALGLLFSVAVFGDTGGFLEDFPAVTAFQRENFVNTALTDVGVALPAQARVHQQFIDVLQAGRLAIDIVFAVAGAVIPPGDHHLVGIICQCPVGVIQSKGCLGKAQLGTLGGTAEDHVLHLGAPEGLGALLAHDPQDGVGNIGFSGAVGAYNGGDIIAEADHRLIRKGLKALQFQ